MQRIVPVPGGVNSYLADPEQGISEAQRPCSCCSPPRRMWRHGWYHRRVLVEGAKTAASIPVARLRCPATGDTVSLLPDFCLPRRQIAPAVLAVFLAALVFQGDTLRAALLAARADLSAHTAHHSQAQSLRDGFQRRLPKLRMYLARFKPHFPEPHPSVADRHKPFAIVLALMREGFAGLAEALRHHSRHFHPQVEVGLI